MALQHVAIAILATAASAAAQPLPELRTEAVPGGSVFHVRNVGSQPLTAVAIELVGYPGSSYWYCEDDAKSPIPPGGEKRIPVTNMTVGAVPDYVKITAAVYVDGSTVGAPDRVAMILEPRKAALETTREAIRRIERAQQNGTPKPALLADFKRWTDSLKSAGRRRVSAETLRQDASRLAANDATTYLEQHSFNETLVFLRAKEQAIASVKP